MSTSLLGPMIVGLVTILFAPALLFATLLLEHLIASPGAGESRASFLVTPRHGRRSVSSAKSARLKSRVHVFG